MSPAGTVLRVCVLGYFLIVLGLTSGKDSLVIGSPVLDASLFSVDSRSSRTLLSRLSLCAS